MSQGILQAIFEYQSMMCSLTGMDASNASVYDGATAAGEAVMICREPKRNRAVICGTVNPQVIETVKTYCYGAGVELIVLENDGGLCDYKKLKEAVDDGTSCVIAQMPNFYGLIEDYDRISSAVHSAGGKFIMSVYPVSLGLLKTPADYGADIAVGEGQSLGLPLAYGGPYLGFMACKEAMQRKLPGRIVGETTDRNGKRTYVLTLQAREQHIRREKASSSICSNEALCALTASMYLSAMGPEGLYEVASNCAKKAKYALKKITEIPGYDLKTKGSIFNEFVTACPCDPAKIMKALKKEGILGGLPLKGEFEGCILWCVTEMNTKEEIDSMAEILKEAAR
jgi:glycine dehydrogenase subunit 1